MDGLEFFNGEWNQKYCGPFWEPIFIRNHTKSYEAASGGTMWHLRSQAWGKAIDRGELVGTGEMAELRG